MAKIKLEIAVLNIAMHNHDEGELSYENLFQSLIKDDIEIQLDETHVACIGELNTSKHYGTQRYFLGQIYKYAKINPKRDCLNTKTKKVATDEEKQVLIIPKHLRPHFIKVPFVFIPTGHRLYIQTKHKSDSFGITRAKKLFELLVQNEEIFQKFGDVEVTIEPDSAEIEKLVNRKDIDKLIIDIVRPNPDDISSAEQALFEKMKKRNLKKQRSEYISTKNENLILDNELKEEIKIAASNGKVVAEGSDAENEKWKTSTEEINLILKTSYIVDRTKENRGEDPAEKHLIRIAFDNHSDIIKRD